MIYIIGYGINVVSLLVSINRLILKINQIDVKNDLYDKSLRLFRNNFVFKTILNKEILSYFTKICLH